MKNIFLILFLCLSSFIFVRVVCAQEDSQYLSEQTKYYLLEARKVCMGKSLIDDKFEEYLDEQKNCVHKQVAKLIVREHTDTIKKSIAQQMSECKTSVFADLKEVDLCFKQVVQMITNSLLKSCNEIKKLKKYSLNSGKFNNCREELFRIINEKQSNFLEGEDSFEGNFFTKFFKVIVPLMILIMLARFFIKSLKV